MWHLMAFNSLPKCTKEDLCAHEECEIWRFTHDNLLVDVWLLALSSTSEMHRGDSHMALVDVGHNS